MPNSNANAPDPTTKAKVTDSGPVAKELACWLRAIRLGWTQSVKGEQENWTQKEKYRFRLKYALSGSFTWIIGTTVFLLGDPRFLGLIDSGVTTAFAIPVFLVFAACVGFLVAFSDRGAGPVRLFLDGMLLPTVTIAIIALSVQRIEPTRVEPPESSNGSPPITLQPEPENASEPENADETPD